MAPSPKTITYKTASPNSLPIKLDLYLPEKKQTNLPILLWFHGGGLLQGFRAMAAPHMVSGVSIHGYALVSADYRLAPQATVAEILTDVQDCLTFIHSSLSQHLEPGTSLDTSRIAVSGSSAGGYLALLAGLYPPASMPPPKAVLAIYPITDPLGKFFTNPQPHPDGKIEESVVAPFLDRNAPAQAYTDVGSPRNKFYYYMMQTATLATLLSVKAGDDTFIIAEQIKKRGKFVPCFVVHGDKDGFVGVEQADEVVQTLKEIGADYEYERLEGLDHLFDTDEKVKMEKMYAFMAKHI